jgi:hypothetical protein
MTTDQKFPVPDLRTPCCNAPLMVYTAWVSGGYYGSEAVDYIECEACFNEWTPTGVSNERNKMPDHA